MLIIFIIVFLLLLYFFNVWCYACLVPRIDGKMGSHINLQNKLKKIGNSFWKSCDLKPNIDRPYESSPEKELDSNSKNV